MASRALILIPPSVKSSYFSIIDQPLKRISVVNVNKQFAEKLIAEAPPISCKEHIACCDGGGGALGHPKVYINLDKPGPHTCGYCGLRYVYDHHHH